MLAQTSRQLPISLPWNHSVENVFVPSMCSSASPIKRRPGGEAELFKDRDAEATAPPLRGQMPMKPRLTAHHCPVLKAEPLGPIRLLVLPQSPSYP